MTAVYEVWKFPDVSSMSLFINYSEKLAEQMHSKGYIFTVARPNGTIREETLCQYDGRVRSYRCIKSETCPDTIPPFMTSQRLFNHVTLADRLVFIHCDHVERANLVVREFMPSDHQPHHMRNAQVSSLPELN